MKNFTLPSQKKSSHIQFWQDSLSTRRSNPIHPISSHFWHHSASFIRDGIISYMSQFMGPLLARKIETDKPGASDTQSPFSSNWKTRQTLAKNIGFLGCQCSPTFAECAQFRYFIKICHKIAQKSYRVGKNQSDYAYIVSIALKNNLFWY